MIGVVLDTNVVVSALLKPHGLEDQVLRLALFGKLRLYVSPPVLAEYGRVLPHRKLKLKPEEVKTALAELARAGTLVNPKHRATASTHEDDNRFLECAEAAGADFLVTGNRKHFPARYKTTRIVNARQLLVENTPE